MAVLLVFLALVSVVNAIPLLNGLPPNSTVSRMLNSERDKNGMVIVGDMKMSEAQILEYYGTPEERGLGESRKIYRWPNGIIPYMIDPSLGSPKHLGMIRKAMDFWEAETCINFKEITDASKPHIYLISEDGCQSYVGYLGYKQEVNLEMSHCEQVNTICHELGHAIGLKHEMARPDRDTYLNYFEHNTNSWNNYEKATKNVVDDVVPYDFESTMHYWIEGGNNKPNVLVVTPKDPTNIPLIDRSIRPSFFDYFLVNVMYGCNKGCNIQCQNGGLATKSTAKGCHCLCPYDTTGSNCENKIKVDYCSKIIRGEGILTPPNRNDPYDEFPKCSFIMKAPKGKKVSVVFHSMNLDCSKKERLIIRTSALDGDKIYKKICQKFNNIETIPIISEGNELQLILINKVSEDAFEADITYV